MKGKRNGTKRSIDPLIYLAKKGITLQDSAEQMEQFDKDCRFLARHVPEFKVKYPNRWVAVYQEQVVVTGKDLPELFSRLKRKRYSRGVAIEFIYPIGEEPVWMLRAAA